MTFDRRWVIYRFADYYSSLRRRAIRTITSTLTIAGMESIFHEKQEGYLCAQHCLNALLQGTYFNAVDLANLAHQMDEEERIRMAESGVDSEDYQRFLEQPSGNMDDSGYFSVQVISSALEVWGLELIPYNGTEPMALVAQNDPSQMQAYICNYKGHWFTIRKIGRQWFNLNSVLSGPQLLSDTYLAMYFAQLLQEGYSIFLVIGALPECVADDVILKNPVTATTTRTRSGSQSTSSTKPLSKGYRLGTAEEDQAKILEAAQALERVKVPAKVGFHTPSASATPEGTRLARASQQNERTVDRSRERIIPIQLEGEDEEEADLRTALQLSLRELRKDTAESPKSRLINDDDTTNAERYRDSVEDPDEEDEIRKAVQLSLECDTGPATPDPDDELRKALQLSLECVTAPTTPDPDDLRRRRLAHLGIHSRTTNPESSTKVNT